MSESINTNTLPPLNDDRVINVTLSNVQWAAVLDWISHCPFQEAIGTLTELNAQIKTHNQTNSDSTTFTGVLPIKTYNMMIHALGLAPYYIVAEILSQIFTQGQKEIERLRDQYNTAAANAQVENNSQPAVEKSQTSPDNSTTTKKRRTSTRKKKSTTASE